MGKTYSLYYSPAAKRDLKRLVKADRIAAKAIKEKLDELLDAYNQGSTEHLDIVSMVQWPSGSLRLKVGKLRVIFREEEEDNEVHIVIEILAIGKRGEIYDRRFREGRV